MNRSKTKTVILKNNNARDELEKYSRKTITQKLNEVYGNLDDEYYKKLEQVENAALECFREATKDGVWEE